MGAAKPQTIAQRLKYAKLPTLGKIRFIPRKNYKPNEPLHKGPNNGYLDNFDNEWVKGPSRTAGKSLSGTFSYPNQERNNLVGHLGMINI